jgi:hypothetical protein
MPQATNGTLDDIVVGAAYASINGTTSGATYVVYGKQTRYGLSRPTSPWRAEWRDGFRTSAKANTTTRAGRVGDVNSDGFDDIGIGASSAGTPDKFISNATSFLKAHFCELRPRQLSVRSGIRFIGVADSDQTGASIAGVVIWITTAR